MSNYVVFAMLFAVLNAIAVFAGWHALEIPFFAIALLFGLMGLRKPGVPEAERRARVAAVLSMILAAIPFLKPPIDAVVLRIREARRAKETAPLYARLQTELKSIGPALDAFRDKTGVYPTMFGNSLLPAFDEKGKPVADAEKIPHPTLAADPFDPTRRTNVIPIGGKGALLVSVGQDGVAEWPDPGVVLSIDGEPSDPLAPFAAAGIDLRTVTYDPTNGALGLGDVVLWHGREGTTMEEALKPLAEAWDDVDRLTPPPAEDSETGLPLAVDDAKTADQLLKDGKWLGALAAASRAVQNRRIHPNFWETPELRRADYIRALALYQLGHFRAAADTMIDYLAFSPNDPEGHYHLAVNLWLGGRRDEARRHFAAAFEMDPKSPVAPKAIEAWEAVRKGGTPKFDIPWAVEMDRKRKAEEAAGMQTKQNQPSADAPRTEENSDIPR